MSAPLLAICGWVVLAFVLQLIPSKDSHWARAYGLIAIGVPLLVWATLQGGPWVGLFGLVVGLLVLRWPVVYLLRWLRRTAGV